MSLAEPDFSCSGNPRTRVSAMSMTFAFPHLDLSACAWKTTKAAVGVGVFIAMSLPIAFPAKVANSAAPVISMVAPQPYTPAKAQTQTQAPAPAVKAKAKAKTSSPAKVEAAQITNKKPLPKNA